MFHRVRRTAIYSDAEKVRLVDGMIKVLERGKKSAAEMEEFVASLRKSQVQDKLFDLLKGNGGDLINCLLLN